jgi:putative ABC transport system substrate-binding protein
LEQQNEKENKMKNDKEPKRKQKSTIYAAIVVGIVIVIVVGGLLWRARSTEQSKIQTVGVVNYSLALDPVLEGFKARMVELGYVEGENITYIYNGVIEEAEAIDSEIESLLAQEVDLLFVLGTPPALQAKQAVEGTDVPVIFAPVLNPVEEGVVDDIRHPGGNVTGVQTGNTIPKALEWLLKIAPGMTKVYVPYNPEDQVSVTSIEPLKEAASALGVELVLDEVSAPEDLAPVVEALPEDVRAIFLLAVPSIDTGIAPMVEVAAERGIATGTYHPYYIKDGVLHSYAPSMFAIGEQAARMVDQALHGTAPADMPVETAEGFLTINLKAAQAAGFDIPDNVLRQADTIIR